MLILLAVFGAYAQTIFYPFVHDEVVFIEESPDMDHFRDLSAHFSHKGGGQSGRQYVRPVLALAYRLIYRIAGAHPGVYHMFNILLHAGTGCMVFLLLRVLGLRRMLAVGITGVFLLHPIQTESVACVSGMSNTLYAFLSLGSMMFFLSYVLHPEREGNNLFLFGSWTAFLLALGVKEQAAVIPMLMLSVIFLFRSRPGFSMTRAKISVGGFGLLFFLYLAWRKIFLGVFFPFPVAFSHELFLRIMAIPRTLLLYVRLLIFPKGLHYYRTVDILQLKPVVNVLAILVCAAVVMLVRRMRERKLAVFGLLWFLITLLPVLNIIPIIHEYSFVAAFEHFL